MSATCTHLEGDAWRHPECAGCAALVSTMTARGIPPSIATLAADLGWSADDFDNAQRNLANAVCPSAAWHATAGSPSAAVLAAQQEFTRRSYDGAARIARDMAAPLDAAVGDALAAGISLGPAAPRRFSRWTW